MTLFNGSFAAQIFYMPFGASYNVALVDALLYECQETELLLSDFMVLLPTRRAVRDIKNLFFEKSVGATLLPRLIAINDLEKEVASLPFEEKDVLKDTKLLTPLVKESFLIRLLRSHFGREDDNIDYHLFHYAKTLSRLIDQLVTYEIEPQKIYNLVPASFADHWQGSLNLLKIIVEYWPQIVSDNGYVEERELRKASINNCIKYWQQQGKNQRIVAIGSHGSTPETAQLLRAVAQLPYGAVVLAGYEPTEGLKIEEEAHPLYQLTSLLHFIRGAEAAKEPVACWPLIQREPLGAKRARTLLSFYGVSTFESLVSEKELSSQFKAVTYLDCQDELEEARCIALKLVSIAQETTKTAMLVTRNRNLANFVRCLLRKWNIKVNDSGGVSLATTQVGSFFLLLLRQYPFDCVKLFSLLKHPLVRCFEDMSLIYLLEKSIRQLDHPIEDLSHLERVMEKYGSVELSGIVQRIASMLGPFIARLSQGKHGIKDLISLHLETALKFLKEEQIFQKNEEGECLHQFLKDLLECHDVLTALSGLDYKRLFSSFITSYTVRAKEEVHPQIQILGPLEARLQSADCVILADMNEGSWPPFPEKDPWMNESMRHMAGLPSYQREVGLAAHDFMTLVSAPEVFITRSLQAQGRLTQSSRFLLLLKRALGYLKEESVLKEQAFWLQLNTRLNQPLSYLRRNLPKPCPDLGARPRSFSATQFEMLLKDPYTYYAAYILELKPLANFIRMTDSAFLGSVIHRCFEYIIRENLTDEDEGTVEVVKAYARKQAGSFLSRLPVKYFWWPRFVNILVWFLKEQKGYSAAECFLEIKGVLREREGNLTFIAKADRIDQLKGCYHIIDYKTGQVPPKQDVLSCLAPQLPLEAFILKNGGYSFSYQDQPITLSYWQVDGGYKGSRVINIPYTADIEAALKEKMKVAQCYVSDPAQTYETSLAQARVSPYISYKHLYRLEEY